MSHSLADLPENLTVPRTDAVYNCHAYLTKVPIGAILPFIETFTKPGDTVLDFFAGSGMTGLAAIRAGRRSELSDISELGKHIATGYLTRVEPDALRVGAKKAISAAREALGDLYHTAGVSKSKLTEMVRAVWSFTYRCPSCSDLLVYFEHISPSGSPPTSCPTCKHPFVKRLWERGPDVPVQVVVRGEDGKLSERPISEIDLERIARAATDSRQAKVPSLQIDEHREMFSRSGLGKAGLRETKSFFSPRNAIALYELWSAINQTRSPELRQKLRFCFTASLARASRRYQWSSKRPLNAQNQTYYIAPIYYEWNVFELFGRKVAAAIRSDDVLYRYRDLLDTALPTVQVAVNYTTASASNLAHLKDESIDYVFTDPPFGSNIFYSDMNLFHEAWIGTATNPENEAVVHTTGKRKSGSAERYERLLRAAFSEAVRVLRPGRYMSVVFGNSSGNVWGLVQRALRDSGFDPAPVHVSVLDKGQRSVKGLSSGSEGIVTVDLVMTVRKPNQGERIQSNRLASEANAGSLIADAIASLSIEDARNPSHVYARILRQAIKQHLPLDDFHLSDVLIALRDAGFSIIPKTGQLIGPREVA
ncbi:DNA methyltransferase [Burkholderia ubonensis]|uniref:DNA methyltransferase n=1 Tax=Burkholderia ubonensis TaxID=101571 RepID=UPI0012FB363E|nr:DNA methyltransferase [Burkholderia ubonensis]